MDYWILFPLCPSWDLQSMILQDDFLFHTTHASYIQVRTKKKKKSWEKVLGVFLLYSIEKVC